MSPHLRTATFKAFIIVTIILSVQSKDKPTFPKLDELEMIFYQTEVQLTDLEQQTVAYATEYHDGDDSTSTRGRLDVLTLGQKLSLYYSSQDDELIQIDSENGCKGGNIKDSIYDYQPVFYGWLNKDPLIIGPSAPLWMAQQYYNKIVLLEGQIKIRDILCDKFSLVIKTERDDVTYNFYFAVKGWTTPFVEMNLRVPIRIEVIGKSSAGEAKGAFYPINQYTDFSYFRPDVEDLNVFQVPEGIGCFYRKASDEMPKMPNAYHFSAELVDLLKDEKNEDSDIEFQRVWYDGINQLARLDKYTKKRYTHELYDFNTGVTYSMVNGSTCNIKPLRNSFFEGYDGRMVGHLKEPEEVLGLDNKFYYVGKKLIRGIWSDVFETIVTKVTFMTKALEKLVITIYYSQANYEVVTVEGETETRVPVYYAVKGWDDKNKTVLNLQYNIFGFNDVESPTIYTSFRLDSCFPSHNEKSYFTLIFNVDGELAARMQGQDDFVMYQLGELISRHSKVAGLRIPFLKADYTSSGVNVMGIVLDRPPALKQFWLEYEGNEASTKDAKLKPDLTANTLEKCAFSCVDEGDFSCTGFFFCGQACFMKSKDVLEPDSDKDTNYNLGDSCQEWLRAERGSTNKEAYLNDALLNLEKAVIKGSIRVTVNINQQEQTFATATDVIFGKGPYTEKDTPYGIKISFAKLIPTAETTEQLSNINTLNDCYMACKRSENIKCSSFSYCPGASNKQCSLSSVLVRDRKTNVDDIVGDKDCYVYYTKPSFPKMNEIGGLLYQTEVQLTDVEHEEVAYATEYHDADISTSSKGRVDLLNLGQKLSLYYFSEDDELIQIDSKNGCKGGNIKDSIYDYQPVFYGWLNKDPLIIGPSAPLWMAQKYDDKIVFQEGVFEIRNILCDKFSLDYKSERDQVRYNFYFAVKNWTTPYGGENLRVPIRIEVIGKSSQGEAKDAFYAIDQYTDFSYFRPDVEDWTVFQLPEGVGCFYRNASDKMPKMPKVYQYSAEVVDLLKAEDNEMSDIEFQRVWYDGVEQLARLDRFTKLRYTSELYDFNTGVTYSAVNGRTCDIKPLRNSFFEGYDGQMIGHLKEPGEVLGLDNKFYYVGNKLIRGIWSDVFETVVNKVTFMKKALEKLVITIYYSQEYYEVVVEDGDTETRVPVYYAVKGWDSENKMVLNLQYNIFGFDNAASPQIYRSFRLGRCFPSVNDKSYFTLIFDVSSELAAKMEGQDDIIMDQLRSLISNHSKVSDLRIPFLRADYTSRGVNVMGLMLDRPPVLKQFWREYKGNDASTNDPYLKVAPASNTLEKCAFACVDEDDFSCTGFFYCDQACFIKSKDILEPDSDNNKDNYNFEGPCQEWIRAEVDSTNKEAYLADALKNLESAVVKKSIRVFVTVDERHKTFATVKDVFIGDGPYTGRDKDDEPYDLKIEFAKLDPTDETTQQLSYIDSLNDCYMACKRSGDIDCSSFSYCPDTSNKQCSLSSVLVLDRKANVDDIVDDKSCYVYSMKYLDFYQEYPGRMALISGEDILNDIKSPEECAKNCRLAKDISCRGFEFCYSTSNCILHSKHVLDLKPGSEVINTDKKTSCVHFAAKYTADYYDMGYVLIDDPSDVRQSLTLEDCSKICSEELKDKCNSFNYCPESSVGVSDSICALTTLILTSPGITTNTNASCHHFEKKEKVDDWGNSNKKPLVNTGYTKSGFTWLVICMLVLGGGIGALGFVVYSRYRSKSRDGGLTVKYVKNDQI